MWVKIEDEESVSMKSHEMIGTAVVTPKGISFLDSYYSCNRAVSEQWFEMASRHGGWTIEVYFSPINVSEIYFRSIESNDEFEVCDVIVPQSFRGSKLEKYFKSIQKLKYTLEGK